MSSLSEYDLKVVSWLMTLCVAVTDKQTSPKQAVELLKMAARNWEEELNLPSAPLKEKI